MSENARALPLTSVQRLIATASTFAPGALLMPVVVADQRLTEVLARGIVDVLRLRHDALRIRVGRAGGRRIQDAEGEGPSLRVMPSGGAAVQRWRDALVEQARSVSNETMRPQAHALYIQSDPKPLLVIGVDHVAFDAVSQGLLEREIRVLLAELVAGRSAEGLNTSRPFLDYVEMETAWLSSDESARAREYWRGALCGLPPRLLPGQDEQARGEGSVTCEVLIDAKNRDRYLRAAKQHRSSNFMYFLCCAFLAQHTVAAKSDLWFRTPSDRRRDQQFLGTLGCILSISIVRLIIDDDQTLRESLARTRQSVFGMLQNDRVPYVDVQSDLGSGGVHRAPMFRLMSEANFGNADMFENFAPAVLNSGTTPAVAVSVRPETLVESAVTVVIAEKSIVVGIASPAHESSESGLRAFASAFCRVADALADTPDVSVRDLL